MSRPLSAIFIRELSLASRIGGGSSVNMVFFIVLTILLPFAIGPDLGQLSRIGPALLWISALLATLLGLDRLLQSDYEDGSLDLMTMADCHLELIIVVKCAAHWITTVLPLIFAAPILALMLGIDSNLVVKLVGSLLLGTPALTLLGMIGAALTVTVRKGGLLMSTLILPFTIPILIFGVSASFGGDRGSVSDLAPTLILFGLTILTLAGAPFAAAAAIRLTRD